MALFTGTYENKVDKKGRVSLPAPFRDRLSGGPERVFYIFPAPSCEGLEAGDEAYMERIAEAIEDQAEVFSVEEDALGQIIADALPVQYDSTGRFILPKRFLDHTGIDETALFVGKAKRFQIWNPVAYADHAAIARERAKGLSLSLRRRPEV